MNMQTLLLHSYFFLSDLHLNPKWTFMFTGGHKRGAFMFSSGKNIIN